jgi:integrase/recombinase XerD
VTAVLTAGEWAALTCEPTKDKAYQLTALGPAVSDYLSRRAITGLAARTLDTYERDLARLCVLKPQKGPGDITTHDLEDVLATFPLPSRKRVRAALRAFFDHLNGDGVIDVDPARRLPTIRVGRQKIIDVFTEAEQSSLKERPRELRDRALVTLMLNSGIRKSEALSLTVADFDLESDTLHITVRRGKGNKGRVIPVSGHMGAETRVNLNDLILLEGLGRHDHLWYTRYVNMGGEYIHRDRKAGPGSFHRWWERMCDEAQVRYRGPHVCRHTFATSMLQRGVSMQGVSRLLGHASISTTVDIYGHMNVDDLAAEIEKALAG